MLDAELMNRLDAVVNDIVEVGGADNDEWDDMSDGCGQCSNNCAHDCSEICQDGCSDDGE